jgi:hypothetical protein
MTRVKPRYSASAVDKGCRKRGIFGDGRGNVRVLTAALVGLGLAAVASGSIAAQKPSAKGGAGKAAPACAALVFRPLPSGASDGEQIAGTYKSRFARLELNGTVQNGTPTNYYLSANGKRISGGAQVPQAAADCAASKKLPKPGSPQSSCTGDKFTAVLAHVGDKRVALLYALNGGAWKFCEAGAF